MGETLMAPVPVIVARVSAGFQVRFTVAGMRMRRSFAAVMVGTAASVTVIAAIAVGACATTKTWFAADTIVGARIWIVRLSVAAVAPPSPATTSCRLAGPEAVVKLMYCSPDTTIWLPPPKSFVTLTTSVLPPSSYVTVVETLLAAVPVIVAVVSAVFHVMLSVAGMRMRISFAFLIVAVAASVTVIGLIAVGNCPAPKVWFEPEAIVCATTGEKVAARPRQIGRTARSMARPVPAISGKSRPRECFSRLLILPPSLPRVVPGSEHPAEPGPHLPEQLSCRAWLAHHFSTGPLV